jgi:hypothetical protein
MQMQIETGIGVALLAGSILMTVHAQTANVSPKKNGNNQSAGISQTNSTDGQRKSGQVVHQDYDKVQAGKPEGQSAPPNQSGTQGSTADNNGVAKSKTKFRQEFGPTQANKKNDLITPSGPGGLDGKPKTADAKKQAPK